MNAKKVKKGMSRRNFIAATATAGAAFTIVPKRVLGFGQPAPSDRIVMAHIGCGTQGHNELGALLNSPDLQFVAVCDPETDGRNYIDFGMGTAGGAAPTRVINAIRAIVGNDNWRAGISYIPGGRMVMKEVIEAYYARTVGQGKYKGVTAYEDFRELLDKEDIDAVKIMTPDHLHATIAVAAMKKGKHVIVHKPLANRMTESNLVIATAEKMKVATYFMPYNSYRNIDDIKKMIADGAIGTLREIHNWTNRPVWPQYLELPTDTPPVPAGFNWDLWLGPATWRPYHPNYTHCQFRGWYDFGGGSLADMGHYSLWTMCDGFDLDVPAWAEAYGSRASKIYNGNTSSTIANDYSFPLASTMHFHYNAKGSRGPIDLFWYDGGMRPSSIPELAEDDKVVGEQGMLLVGDKGKILDNRLIPESRMKAYMGAAYTPPVQRQFGAQQVPAQGAAAAGAPGAAPAAAGTPGAAAPAQPAQQQGGGMGSLPPGFDKWIAACRGGDKNTPGNFISAKALSTMVNLGYVALRCGRKITYDPVKVELTNYPEGNKYLTREYRKGWELSA